MYNIAVIGAGVIGTSTALNIQKLLPSARVKIIAEKFGQETTSWGAGGLFRPTLKYIQGVTREKLMKWSKAGWDRFSSLALSDRAGITGMQIVPGFILSQTKVENPVYKELVFSFHELTREEMSRLGFSMYQYGYEVTTIITILKHYLPWLYERFKENGGEMEQRKIEDLNEFVGVYDVVVNCTAMGSQKLFGDKSVYPVRGQLLRVKAPWIKKFIFTEDDAYIIPNGELLCVGGIRQKGNYNMNLVKEDSDGILQRCYRICPELKGAKIDHEWVGLRPTRSPIRIEKEVIHLKKGALKVVHNYGHGANGISMSWGTSVDAAQLVKESLVPSPKL